MHGPAGARIVIDGRSYINFVGSGYLALSQIPEIRREVLQALNDASPFARQFPAALGLNDPIFAAVEREAAAACGTESSVYLASGYFVGMVGLASIAHPFHVIAIDDSAHHSLYDAAKLSDRPTFRFAHCDADALRDLLRRHVRVNQIPLILTDGAFATTGRIPPLATYASLIAPYDGRIFVDESHSFGVVGANGRGSVEYCGVENVSTCGATLSKAYCGHGAIVACDLGTANRLTRHSVIRGACSGSPLSAIASKASLEYVAKHPDIRLQMRELTEYFRMKLRAAGLDVIESPAPIVSFQLDTREDMEALQTKMLARGVLLYHSDYVGAGANGVIRCAVFRDHVREDIDALVESISF
jgi:7-keto-8-aminopelargonate synthetase-like enzyme